MVENLHIPGGTALRSWAWAIGAVSVAAIVAAVLAEAPRAEPPAATGPSAVLAYGVPYDPAAGEPLYNAHCAACHDHPSDRTPSRSVIANNTPAYILGALTDGLMRANAASLTHGEKLSVAMFVSQNKSGGTVSKISSETPACTNTPAKLTLSGPGWNGWGRTVQNSRYQPDPGITAAQVPRLKLKWAMAVSGNRNGQSVIAGGRLFTNDTAGSVYSLDAKTGCAYWRFSAEGPTRSTISVAKIAGTPARIAAFFTDAAGYLYAIDAENGALIWRTKIDEQRSHQFTGSVTIYQGAVYAPVASGEEAYAMDDAYPCCKFRGALVAVLADTGKILWTTYTTQSEPKVFKNNRIGNPMYGPSGGAIWSAPTIDAKRGVAYVATGDSYTDVPHEGSDAVIAVNLKTGKIVWIKQLTAHDSYIIGCEGPQDKRHANCPDVVGADYDLGASPTLMKRADGKQVILASQKSSQVYALDPDEAGRVIWQKRLSTGGPLGGSEWGHAVDERNIYVGISDIYVHEGAKPQLSALNVTDGAPVWTHTLPQRPCRWTNVYCSPGISMAVTAIPGVVFAGSMDGWLSAYSTLDGNVLWTVDIGGSFVTTSGLQADGGALDAAGPVIAGGMLYIHTGYWGRTGPGSVLLAFSVDGK
jgi:polyvinyl alcohol dehydrogenase (cytochrome)